MDVFKEQRYLECEDPGTFWKLRRFSELQGQIKSGRSIRILTPNKLSIPNTPKQSIKNI